MKNFTTAYIKSGENEFLSTSLQLSIAFAMAQIINGVQEEYVCIVCPQGCWVIQTVWLGGCGLCSLWGNLSILTWTANDDSVSFPVRNCFRSYCVCRSSERQKWMLIVPERLLIKASQLFRGLSGKGSLHAILSSAGVLWEDLCRVSEIKCCQTCKHLSLIPICKWIRKCGWTLFSIGSPQVLKIHVNKNKFAQQFKIEQSHS